MTTTFTPTATGATIYLGGGCFWCIEAVFTRVRGVLAVRSGYANGHLPHPSYAQVCTGDTGHAEVVQLQYDPQQLPLALLLEIFFASHDPTTPNRQGNDVGPQYRSAIYTTTPAQLTSAQAFAAQLNASGQLAAPVVTEIAPLTAFWPAEAEHERYFDQHRQAPYCQWVIAPKVDKLHAHFAEHTIAGES